MKINVPILVGGGLIVGSLIYVLGAGFGHDPHAVPFLLTGKQAPAFTLPRIDSTEQIKLSDFAGKPLVLNFWSSWCIPCKSEHPIIEWGKEKLGGEVNFVGVVYQDSLPNVREYLVSHPSKLLQLFDESGRVAVDYGLAGVPETYFITHDGRIQYKQIGPIDADGLLARVADLQSAQQLGKKP